MTTLAEVFRLANPEEADSEEWIPLEPFVAVPLRAGSNNLVGLLCARPVAQQVFSEEEQNLLAALGKPIAMAMAQCPPLPADSRAVVGTERRPTAPGGCGSFGGGPGTGYGHGRRDQQCDDGYSWQRTGDSAGERAYVVYRGRRAADSGRLRSGHASFGDVDFDGRTTRRAQSSAQCESQRLGLCGTPARIVGGVEHRRRHQSGASSCRLSLSRGMRWSRPYST